MYKRYERVQLYVNTTKSEAVKLSEKVKLELLSEGYEIVSEDADIVIGFGGDGTLLHFLNETNYNMTAMYIGVNCGTLGFLQDFNLEEVESFVKNIPTYVKQYLRYVVMEVEIFGSKHVYKALNEITIQDSADKSFRTKISMDNELLEHYVGTGLIFSTPTGSTALNLSAGGCILHPSIEAIQVTPREAISNSKMRCLSKSICLPAGFDVTLTKNSEGYVKICCDGRKVHVGPYDKIRVYYAEQGIVKLRDEKDSFIKTIREKLI